MSDLWDAPGSYPATPTIESDEGYPIYTGYASTPVYYAVGPTRPAQQILGVDFYDGPDKTERADMESVEGGRFNDMRRVMYRAQRRLWVLNYLAALWPAWWDSIYNADDEIGNNFANIYTFQPASGQGTTIEIQWSDDPLAADARQLYHEQGYSPIHPGCVAMVDATGWEGMAIVTDVEFLGFAAGVHKARLTLHRPLNATAAGLVRVVIESKPDVLPHYALRIDDADAHEDYPQCRHAIKTFSQTWSTLKAQYPTLPTVAGIYGSWFCDRLDRSDVDLSQFAADQGRCNNTDCPYYEAHIPWYPYAGDDFTNFWLGRGRYIHEGVAGGFALPAPESVVRLGKDTFTGLGALIGLPCGYFPSFSGYNFSVGGGAAYLARKDYYGIGDLFFRTGETTAEGYDEFLNFMQIQAQRVTDGDLEHDNVGVIQGHSVVTKRDPGGGLGYATRTLQATAPGYDFERTVGVRRLGRMDLAEDSEATGYGNSMVQRVRPRKYTSAEFSLPYVHPDGTLGNANGETVLWFQSTPQAFANVSAADAFSYDLTWNVPHFGETVRNPATARSKGGSVAAASITFPLGYPSAVLRADFKTGATPIVYGGSAGPPPVEPTVQSATCGGNLVRSMLSREILNPAAGRAIGDRQTGLCPGDTVRFDTGVIADLDITCIRAEAFGGDSDPGATTQPNPAAPGVPDYVANNYDVMDRAWFALDGYNGRIVKKFAGDGGFAGGDVQLTRVSHSAVGPPTVRDTGASTGYEPNLYRVNAAGATTLLTDGTDYVWDPNTGTFYLDSSGWGAGPWRLHFTGYVNERRRSYVCEDAEACDAGLSTIVNNDAYIEDGQIVVAEHIALCLVKKSDQSINSTTIPMDVFGAYDSPTWQSFNWPSRPLQPYFDTDVYEIQWRKYNWLPYSSVAIMGDTKHYIIAENNSNSGVGNPGDARFMDFRYLSWIWTLRPPARWAKDQIQSALLDVDFGDTGFNADAYTAQYNCTVTGPGAGDAWELGTQTQATTFDIALGLYKITTAGDGQLSFTPIQRGGLATLTKIAVSGDDHFRGTVDVTDAVKALYDHYFTLAANEELALMFVGDAVGGGAGLGISEQLTGWAGPWSGTWDGAYTGDWIFPAGEAAGTFTAFAKAAKYITAKSISFETLRIQADPDELDVNYQFTSDGHSHGPDPMIRSR